MAGKRRIAGLEQDLQLAEAAYQDRLAGALRRCVGGQWGLFGANDSVLEAHFGTMSRPRSLHPNDARELLDRGAAIAELRSRLGYADAFQLHERYLAYRKMATGHNASGEPQLAQEFLDEIMSAPTTLTDRHPER